MKSKIGVVIMASGRSSRFGEDKLLYEIDGVPIAEHIFRTVKECGFYHVAAVVRSEKLKTLAGKYGFEAIMNDDPEYDTAVTIKKGVSLLPPDCEGVMLFVADQPYLRKETVLEMAETFSKDNSKIYRASFEGEAGNPVIFPCFLREELENLNKNERGMTVIKRHPDIVEYSEAQSKNELFDIDKKEDVQN